MDRHVIWHPNACIRDNHVDRSELLLGCVPERGDVGSCVKSAPINAWAREGSWSSSAAAASRRV